VFGPAQAPDDGLAKILNWARHAFLPNGNGRHR
jgi:hypothetical protein